MKNFTEEDKLKMSIKRVNWKKLRKVRNPKWKEMINTLDKDEESMSGYIHIYKGGVQGQVEEVEKIHKSQLAEYKKDGWKTAEERIRSDFTNMAKGIMSENSTTAKETLDYMYNSGLFKTGAERIAELIKPTLQELGMGRNMEGQLNYDPTRRKGTFASIKDIEYLGSADYNGNSGTLYAFTSGSKRLWFFQANSPKSENYQSIVLGQDPR